MCYCQFINKKRADTVGYPTYLYYKMQCVCLITVWGKLNDIRNDRNTDCAHDLIRKTAGRSLFLLYRKKE